MNPVSISIAVLIATLVAAFVGFRFQRTPALAQLDDGSRSAIKTALGFALTLTAVVFGMVTASAKDTYDQANELVGGLAVDAITLDKVLDAYGPETADLRRQLKADLEYRIERLEAPETYYLADLEAVQGIPRVEELYAAVTKLEPVGEYQKDLKDRALDMIGGRMGYGEGNMAQKRWLFTVRPVSVPTIFLIVMVGSMAIEFFGFGLFSSPSRAASIAIVLSAIVVAGTMFLLLELDDPIDGYFRVSVEPLKRALALLNL
ncbi:MAG: hypothetical protein ACO4BU_11685 [Phycisphaerales bacterium]|jgi:hypothetical protein